LRPNMSWVLLSELNIFLNTAISTSNGFVLQSIENTSRDLKVASGIYRIIYHDSPSKQNCTDPMMLKWCQWFPLPIYIQINQKSNCLSVQLTHSEWLAARIHAIISDNHSSITFDKEGFRANRDYRKVSVTWLRRWRWSMMPFKLVVFHYDYLSGSHVARERSGRSCIDDGDLLSIV
jgi:hypothetical protein